MKNNLQMITALIRLEARNIPALAAGEAFDRLAGRIESLSLLYKSLSEQTLGESVDLGVYLNHSLVDDKGCTVIVADDGNGFAAGTEWPEPGRLGALIVRSLRQNARARLTVDSVPGKGVRVTIFFARADATPEAA